MGIASGMNNRHLDDAQTSVVANMGSIGGRIIPFIDDGARQTL